MIKLLGPKTYTTASLFSVECGAAKEEDGDTVADADEDQDSRQQLWSSVATGYCVLSRLPCTTGFGRTKLRPWRTTDDPLAHASNLALIYVIRTADDSRFALLSVY